MKQFDPENAGGVTFEKFIEYMTNKTKDTDSKEELLASFKELANDKVKLKESLKSFLKGICY